MNLEIQEKFADDIEQFKSKIFKKYKVRLYIHGKLADYTSSIALPELWSIYVDYIEENCPEFLPYTNFKIKTRKQGWMTIYQCFVYTAYKKLGFYKNEIGRFTGKTHATIINCISNVESFIENNDSLFMPVYEELTNKYTEYVRAISENTEVQDNS